MLVKKTINHININEIFFFLALGIYLSDQIFEYTVWGYYARDIQSTIVPLLRIMRYIAYLLCIIKICMESYKRNRFYKMAGTAVLCIITVITSHYNMIFIGLLFILAAEKIKTEKLIKFVASIQSVWLFSVVLSAIFNFTENYSRYTGGRTRYFLGFGWTTTAPILFLFIVWEFIYLKKDSFKRYHYIVILLIGFFFYQQTKTRMAFFMLITSTTFFMVWSLRKRRHRAFNCPKWGMAAPWICAIVSFIMIYFYGKGNAIMHKLDRVLSNRLDMGYNGIKNFGIHLFGQQIKWVGFSIFETQGTYNFVDCSYLNILFNFGLIFLSVTLFAYTLILYGAYKRKDAYLTWIILFILLFSITEPRLLNLMYNPFIFLTMTELKPISVKKFSKKYKMRTAQI